MPKKFFYGWVIVGIAIVSMALIYGIRHSFSVFFAPILKEFGWSRGNVSAMLSLNIFFYGFLAPVAGILVERWDARKMMALGITLLGVATAGCAFAHELSQFYFLFGILMPWGTAFSGWPILGPALMRWFEKKRGLVMGLGQMGGGLSFTYSIFVEFNIVHWGWRNTFLILAAVLVFLLLPLHYFFFYYRPQEKGLKAYGADEKFPVEDLKDQGAAAGHLRMKEWTLKAILHTYQLWLLVSAYALFWGIGAYLVMAHQVKFAEDVGYSPLFGVSIFALVGIMQFMGQLSGVLSDFFGREKTCTLAGVFCMIALSCLILVRDTSSPWLLYTYSICFGYGIGLFSPSIFAACADIFFGKYFGTVAGLLLTGMGVGGILGPWLGGYLFDITGSYTSAFILSMASMAMACVCVWIAAPRKAVERG